MRIRYSRPVAVCLALSLPVAVVTGCANLETREKGAGIGAVTGALVGGAIGYAIDDSAEGVIIGALGGAAAGGILGYIVGEKLEDRDEASAHYEEQLQQPGVDEVLDIRRVTVDPDMVRAGQPIDINVVHSYVGPVDRQQEFEVEVMLVDQDGRILMNQEQEQVFENGTYSSTITFEVPSDLTPGRYGIDVAMRTGNVTDNSSALFSVN